MSCIPICDGALIYMCAFERLKRFWKQQTKQCHAYLYSYKDCSVHISGEMTQIILKQILGADNPRVENKIKNLYYHYSATSYLE